MHGPLHLLRRGICFDQACAIEVRECGHQMCVVCTLALCCHAKPNPATQSQTLPTCPFCRGGISRLVVATRAKAGDDDEEEEGEGRLESPRHRRSRRSVNLGSSSISLMGSIASSIGIMVTFERLSVSLHPDWPPRGSASDENAVQIHPCALPRPTLRPRGPCICLGYAPAGYAAADGVLFL